MTHINIKKATILLLCQLIWLSPFVAEAQVNFKETLQTHINAILDRDMSGMAATVADSVNLIFPDGELLTSKNKFLAFHEEWFKDKLWRMEPEIINTNEGESLSYALIRYKYTSLNPDQSVKSISHTFLLLVFEKQQQAWKLIHDQNTKILRPQ